MPIVKGFRALVDEAMAQVRTYTVDQVLARQGDPRLQLIDIRCLSPTLAMADGRWELRMLDGTKPYAGYCTLVLNGSGSWRIEAWRYTVDPAPNTIPAPTILKKPGWPGGPGGE